ncbi:retrotransposon-related protein, partial [Tanacetum coccineum]
MLGDAFSLARVTEARFADHGSTPDVATMRDANTVTHTTKPNTTTTSPLLLNGSLSRNDKNGSTKDAESPGSDALAEEDKALESGDISILNSLVGLCSPRSLHLWGTVGAGEVHVLIDNSSTHNFMRPDVVERMYLPLTATKVFKVYIGSGETLLCENVCVQVPIQLLGFSIDVDLYVLPMQGPDVVLGIQWLQKLGKGDESLRMKRISLHRMQALLET